MKLLFVGDVMLGRLVNDYLPKLSPKYPWGNTLDLFASADLRMANLECALSDRGSPWVKTPKVFHFRSDAKNVDVLKAANINLVSLANNHILDYGHEACLDTLHILDSAGIQHAGAGSNIEQAKRPAICKVKNTTIGFLSITDNEPVWEATENDIGIYYMPIDVTDKRFKALLELVKKTKSQVDLLIIALHWGPNWGYRPQPPQMGFAHVLIDHGVDIVFGHSCHVYQGIEIYKNRPILYSTGDFIDDYAVDLDERNDHSFIFIIDIEPSGLKNLRLYPTCISDFQANLAQDPEKQLIANRMQSLCKEMHAPFSWNGQYLELGL